MPSFTTLTALASLAFAAIGSAIPLGSIRRDLQAAPGIPKIPQPYGTYVPTPQPGPQVQHHKHDLSPLDIDILTRIASIYNVKLEDLINVVQNYFAIGDHDSIHALNAEAHQSRDVDTDILSKLGIDLKSVTNVVGNVAQIASGNDLGVANAKAIQGRELPDGVATVIAEFVGEEVQGIQTIIDNETKAANTKLNTPTPRSIEPPVPVLYHVDIITIISNYLGIGVQQVLDVVGNKFSVLDGLNLDVANAKAIQARHADHEHLLPGDVYIITLIANYFHINLEDLLDVVDNKIDILPNANVEVLNAKATQVARDLFTPLAAAGVAVPALVPRGGVRTLPEIIVELTAKVSVLCDHIKVILSVKVDHAAIVHLEHILHEIKVLLSFALDDLKILVAHPIENVLVFKGKVLTVEGVAKLFAELCISVITVLGLVFKAVATLKAQIILALVTDISITLAGIIAVGIKLVGGLLPCLVPLLSSVVHIVLDIPLSALIKVLQLTA